MNPEVDKYLIHGCGRCEYFDTPQCKVNSWRSELKSARSIILECGLNEELKWSNPCYTFNSKNVLMLGALKDACVLSFFKGTLLKDPHGVLKSPGKNSQADRRLEFTSVKQIDEQRSIIKEYIFEAIEIEKQGLKVNYKKEPEPLPDELQIILNNDPELKSSFEALTPGRQRGYILYFSAPKQSKTRISRIEKFIPKIMEGKGFHDR